MVLEVEGLRRLFRLRLSDESQGIRLCGSRGNPHGADDGGLEAAAPCREKRRAKGTAPAAKEQKL